MAQIPDLLSVSIKRTAVDPFGRLGSLYDTCQDRVLQPLDISFEKPPIHFPQKTKCIIEKGYHNQQRNPLEIIGINEHLRLSLALNIISKHGITSAMNYPYIINQYTRVIHYTYIHQEEELPNDFLLIQTWLETMNPGKNATHFITGVSWGIDIVIFLQLPTDENLITIIDTTLDKYRAYLNGDCDHFKLTRDDIFSYTKLVHTKVYSNIPVLNENSTLHDIFHNITRRKLNHSEHQQIAYTLCPLQSIFAQSLPSTHYTYIVHDISNEGEFEEYLFDLSRSLKTLENYFDEDMSSLLCGHFKDRLSNAYKQWYDLKTECNRTIDELASLVTEMRSGSILYQSLKDTLQNEEQIRMKNHIKSLTQDVNDLNAKGHLISDLGHQEIQYCNVIERHVNENDNEESLKSKLIIDQNSDRVLCSNDQLNKANPELLKELRHALVEELERNSKLRLTYADFSYSSFELPNMAVIPLSKYYMKKIPKQSDQLLNADINSSMSSVSTTAASIPMNASVPTNESINILLLGEIGVGKSMFINSFVNYVTFNTFERIHMEKPLVPIPVSFFISVGDNFEERLVKYDDENDSKNENFDNSGQSVTQQCKSYVFHPNHNDRSKLRIIDTPGFGDIRGVDQDHLIMEHIFEYIKKISHLNAICILLKSNQTELNSFLPICLERLYEYFGSSIRRNLIFCFTHTRSSSYTSGNAGVLLKDLLPSLPIRKIPLKKKNTFCFDNEFLRYLIALQNHITFSDQNREEYETSWTKSVLEANRLIRYIRKNLTAIPVPNEWEAIKRAQIEIAQLIHPLLETIRHILRNIIIRKINSMKVSIQLHSEDIPLDEREKDNYEDQHLPYQPTPLDFLQNYDVSNCPLAKKQNEMIKHLSFLYDTSAEFGYFLAYCTVYSNGNPFLTGLFRLMTEEKNVCDEYSRSYMNMQLVESLKALSFNYEECMKTFKSDRKRFRLSEIQERIRYMYTYPLVSAYVIEDQRTSNGIY
ncbi:hypothetical protein I4U23_019843 [Adineta vaga]|nr:hypothetical protein I4U23_019843 [Adineta vaga]